MPRTGAFLSGFVALCFATTVTAADPPATQTIARLNAGLYDALKNAEQLGYRGRFDKLATVVPQAFDVDFMAEKSIGKYWKPLSDADKARWIALFKEFTIANYAGNLNKFSGQRFEINGEEPDQN